MKCSGILIGKMTLKKSLKTDFLLAQPFLVITTFIMKTIKFIFMGIIDPFKYTNGEMKYFYE